MIARIDDDDVQQPQRSWIARHVPETGAFLFLLASFAFYFNSTRSVPEPTEWEVERTTKTPVVPRT